MLEITDLTHWYGAAGPRAVTWPWTGSRSGVADGELVSIVGPSGLRQVHPAALRRPA